MKLVLRIATLTFAMLAGCAAAVAQTYPFEGRWARQTGFCRNVWGTIDDPGRVPIAITARRLRGPLMTCTFRSVRPAGPDRWAVSAICEGEGERSAETFTLAVGGGRLRWSRGDDPGSYVRCPR